MRQTATIENLTAYLIDQRDRAQTAIDAMKTIRPVLDGWAGKVINKRLADALQATDSRLHASTIGVYSRRTLSVDYWPTGHYNRDEDITVFYVYDWPERLTADGKRLGAEKLNALFKEQWQNLHKEKAKAENDLAIIGDLLPQMEQAAAYLQSLKHQLKMPYYNFALPGAAR